MIFAVLDVGNVIINVVVSGEDWTPPKGTTVRDLTGIEGGIGWIWLPGASSPVNLNPPTAPVKIDDTISVSIRRRAAELEKGTLSEQIESLRLRLSLVEGQNTPDARLTREA